MTYFIACTVVFLAAYTLNIVYVSIFYHRALAHQSIQLKPWVQKFIVLTGNWLTGLDPKAWVCMHRMHHKHSDTPLDPHSPVSRGIASVFLLQLRSYNKTLCGLIHGRKKYTSVVEDLRFEVSWLNRHQVWYLPYLIHGSIALLIGFLGHAWLMGALYWIGMMSHPIQGWMVNALAHRYGYRNFDLPDNSRNNRFVAWLVFGEGYQNNHHYRPEAADFAARKDEIDLGFVMCRILASLKILKLNA